VASDIRDELEENPAVDLGVHIKTEYERVLQPFVVVMTDGRVFANREVVPPALARNTRNRLTQMTRVRPQRPRRLVRPLQGGRAEAPILVNGEIVGLVTVPAVRIAPLAALQSLGPLLAVSGLGFLVVGAAAAAFLIFGPVRRRLRDVQEAASKIGAGDTRARAPDQGGDEVTVLARSFNLMAADLQARAAALEASDQARRQLLADVSHELMTPLTAMRGYLETLAMAELQLDPPTRERYLHIVDEETRRLERIVGDLLDLARLEGGGTPMRRERVDIAPLFDRVAERHQRELDERRIRLTQRITGVTQITGDADRLEQVLQNLAANALRHTPEGGEISLIAEPAGSGARIVVRDSGPGIAPDHLPLIFDRFYKADAARATSRGLSRAESRGGSGLGLSIVKAIVEAHGGTIAARNDKGAVFEIFLPA
jgi:signal transduction histidine kinase